jgi:hypothetical protein
VAVPAHCPVTAIHTLLVGLPSLEALFTWNPADSQPIYLGLARHLNLIVTDLATLSRVMGPNSVQRVSCNAPLIAMEALRRQALDAAPQRRPPPALVSMPCPENGAPMPEPCQRPLSLFIDDQVKLPATRNDAVGYRLATWQQTEPASSRPSSPEPSLEAPVLRPSRTRRLRSACESLLARLPTAVLRRSKSI